MSQFVDGVIALVGCGGTGSYFCDHLVRLLSPYGELRRLYPRLVVTIDADIVSSANTSRQNFGYRDINEHKGLVLQRKLQQHYNVQSVDFWASYANKRLLTRLMKKVGTDPLIIISCVDNHRTRNRIMSFLKPDPDSWEEAKQNNWLYLDAGNDITSGWISAMANVAGKGYGIDMRQQDISMREDSIDNAPTVAPNGTERRGCGATSSSPLTYWGNQQNAMLLGYQLKNICKHGKGYGLQAWECPNIAEAEDWQTKAYQNHFLTPFEIA